MKTVKPIGHIIKKWADDLGLPAEYFEKLTSTNDHAKNSSAALVITDQQTSGRGRGHNKWMCPSYGDYFLTTWIFRPSKPVQPILSPLVGWTLYQSLQQTWMSLNDLSLKPPNDIYLKHHKLAGILIENLTQAEYSKVLIGIGINMLAYPSSLQATSLAEHNQPIDQQHINCLLSHLWQKLSQESIPEALQSQLTLQKRQAIQQALNQHPLRKGKNKYKAVRSCGSLETDQGIIPWQDL